MMKKFSFGASCFAKISAEGRRSLLLVGQFVQALLDGDAGGQLELLSEQVTIDYAGKYGLGEKKLLKADALNFHHSLRSRIEVTDYNIFNAYGDASTVILLGDTTEKTVPGGRAIKENCIWVYTLRSGLIKKIEFLKPSHPLFPFFTSIIDRNAKMQ